IATPDGPAEHVRVRRRARCAAADRARRRRGELIVLESIGYSGWVLTALLLIPAIGMAAVLVGREEHAKHVALAFSTLAFLVSLPLWFDFTAASPSFQFEAAASWIPQWGIRYHVGVDGISVLLVLLTTALFPITILGAYNYITRRDRSF